MHAADAAFRRSRWVYDPLSSIRQSREAPAAPSGNLLDELAAIHESAHVVFAHVNAWPIHSVEIEGRGNGGGQFRTHPGPDLMPQLTGNEPPVHVSASDKSRREWCKTLVTFIVPKFAQRRYAGTIGDPQCGHDDLLVSRILSSISRSPEDERRMRAEIEDEAERFVRKYWGEILSVARALYQYGRLDKQQIASLLRVLPTKVTLNQAAADYASSLIAAGKVSWKPFTWNDDTDGADLLDGRRRPGQLLPSRLRYRGRRYGQVPFPVWKGRRGLH
jgi:hypothetical protein